MPINYNSKMSRQYTQKPTSNLPWNWTDQRVQEIMKKYEQPLPSPRCQERTPLRNRNSNYPSDQCDSGSKSPWKQNYYKPPPSRQDCTPTPQNKTFDLFSKENSYERSDRSRGLDGGRSSKGIRYKGEGEMSSIYDYTPKSKENDLMDAKNYLREQERKYLKIDVPQMPQRERVSWQDKEESNWREDYKRRDEGRRREKTEHHWNQREETTYKEREVTNWRQRDSLRSQKMKTEYQEPTIGKDYGRQDLFKDVEYEPRINNIERINNKIKKILESAQEDKLKVHESTTVELKPIPTNTQATPNPINKKPQQTKEGGAIREFSIYQSSGRKMQQRSKSCLALKKDKNIQPTCELSQKVNDQLAKFNNKITELQEQKRKLNISFKNVALPTIPITSPMQLAQNPQIHNSNDNDEISPLSPLTNTHQESPEEEQVSPNFHSPYIGLKDLDSRDDSLCLESHEQLQQITRNMELRRRQREAEIESSPQIKPSVETNKLMAMLSEQVQLDEQLQLAKKWFARCAQESDWNLLQELLAQRWREMTNEELQAEFSITLDEEDPFYSYRPDEFELEDLVANYIICCRHWGEKVEGQWSGTQLRGEDCFRKLDRDGRGEAGVEDLVRQINLSQEVFYRTRNLYLIFQRLTHHGAGRLTEERFYSVLAKK